MSGVVPVRICVLGFLSLLPLARGLNAQASPSCNIVTAPPSHELYGMDYSPYLDGQDPNLGTRIGIDQIVADLQTALPHTRWIRSYSSTHGLENIPSAARALGFCVAAGAWISTDAVQNALEIQNLIAAVNAGLVDIAIVGSEVILRRDATVAQLVAYMNQVRQAIPANIPVTTADVWGTFVNNPPLVAQSDVVMINLFPYWEQTSIGNAMCSLITEYQQIKTLSGSKTTLISETGWPSAGDAQGAALPSPENAALFADQFLTWAAANNVPSFFFEFRDEAWKAKYGEGPQGAHWGLFDANGIIKPGMDNFFNGVTAVNSCNGTIPGPVAVAFTYVPPYGNGASDQVEVQATGIQTATKILAPYIKVAGSWWTKPTQLQPTVPLNPDGSAKFTMVSGGNDAIATDIALFLIPAGTVPPLVLGGALPSIASAVASAQVTRTPSSINGAVTDKLNVPLFGAIVTDPILGSTTAAPDGKFSFFNITASGTVNPVATYPNYFFAAPTPFSIPAGNRSGVNFQGTPTVDLSVESSLSSSLPALGSPLELTIIISNAGPPSATDAIVTVSIPTGLSLVSATSTRGTCNVAAVPLSCDVGSLPRTAGATITVVLTPTVPGPFVLSASVTGPDLDTNTSNNATSQNLTVAAASTATTIGVITPEPSLTNQAYSVAYTVTSSGGTPAGNVTVSDGSGASCTATVAAGVCSLASAIPGTKTITVSYGGSASFAASSNTASHVVNAPVSLPAASHTYDLTASLLDLQGGPALTALGGAVSGAGYTFARGNGVTGTGLVPNPASYTIAVRVEFDNLALGDGWVKILDLNNQTSDTGLYYDNQHRLGFYPDASVPSPAVLAGAFHLIAVTRDATTSVLRIYLDGVQYGSDILDSNSTAVIGAGAPILFFTDDNVSGGMESAPGIATFIGVWNSALTPQQVALITQPPPLPATATTTGVITPEPSLTNQAYSVAYTVTSLGGTPAGNVTVSDGSGASCTATVAAGVCSLTSTIPGTKTITVSYGGSASVAASSNTASHVVNAPVVSLPAASHAYDLTVSLLDLQGGPALTALGGTVSGAGYTFARGNGVTGTGLVPNPASYTIAVRVEFDNLALGDGWVKILDLNNQTSDTGLYYDNQHRLGFYPYASVPSPAVLAGAFHLIAVTRDATTSVLRIYLDGVQYGSDILDSNSTAVIGAGAPILFFTDDNVSGGMESAPGIATFIGVWNSALTPQQVALITQPPPLPATATTTGVITPEPSLTNQAYSVAYTVTSLGGTPAGNVTVSDGSGASCTATVAAGVCSLTSATPGTKTITVSYVGSASFAASSNTASHVVNAPVISLPAASHAYDLTVSLLDLQGGPALTALGGTVSGAGYTFASGNGVTGTGLVPNPASYTIAIRVEFGNLALADGWVKILDLNNQTSDAGLYYDNQHRLGFYPYASVPSPAVLAGAFHLIAVTRDAATNVLRVYLDGVQYGSDIVDSNSTAVFGAGAPMVFLTDDNVSGGMESAPGIATFIGIWNSALTPQQVALID